MKIMELMNYRFENPNENVNVDTKICENFVSKDRNESQVEKFELWGSVSKENINVTRIIEAYKKNMPENNNTMTR